MKRFIVRVQEVYVQEVLVEATDEHDARLRVAQGEGDSVGDRVHVDTLRFDNWSVEEAKQTEPRPKHKNTGMK